VHRPAAHIAIMSIDKLATKVAMEANAAMSRSKSVIVISCSVMFLFCSHFVLKSTGEQTGNHGSVLMVKNNEFVAATSGIKPRRAK
jgi:hypothetical protein